MKRHRIIGCLLLWAPCLLSAQDINWWNPATAAATVIEGQAWPDAVKGRYDRLPASSEQEVRDVVWRLSTQSAGLMIRFRSDAEAVQVRYQTTNPTPGLAHMPATGVSGVDLYAISSDGEERWCAGRFTFKDTISYHFNQLVPNDTYHKKGREYRLYLPLYNGVKWMEIGVPAGAAFEVLPVRPEKPVVIYGTSIAQGACASRPGMAWTAILGRKLDRPVINLGFSGNGRLEKEIIHPMATLDAKVFVLDNLPNLTDPVTYPDEEVRQRLLYAVNYLREKRPEVPIVLASHAGYTEQKMNATRRGLYERLNRVLETTFAELKAAGATHLYLIPMEAFGQSIETMVDGTHPSDLGMMRYAEGYETALRRILNEPAGTVSTTRPCTQLRELGGYDWEARHREILEYGRKEAPHTVLIGNSITHYWGGLPYSGRAAGRASWDATFGTGGVLNMGYGWDRIENVLWRVYHGELDGYQAQQIFVMIGTNNLQSNTDEEIVEGWRQLLPAITSRQPGARVYMTGIYPRRNLEQRIHALNLQLAMVAAEYNAAYINPGSVLLDEAGKIVEALFSDGLHPNAAGYEKLGVAYRPYLEK